MLTQTPGNLYLYMGAGIIELAAIGPQDIMLFGQPQMTFFNTVYRRHTNFSIESIPSLVKVTFLSFSSNS